MISELSQETIPYKVIFVGDETVGKTTFLKKHVTSAFQKEYEPTSGVNIWHLDFQTSSGMIRFNCWDISGQEKYNKYRKGYYLLGEAAIIMFDVMNYASYENVEHWYNELIDIYDDIPIILCGNKVDVRDRQVKPKEITVFQKNNMHYCDISAKSNYNFEKPFLLLARKFYNDPNLQFLAE